MREIVFRSLRVTLPTVALVVAALVASPGSARADDVPLDPEARIEEARAEFARGRRDFARGRFEDALGHFERSHRLTASPDLVYNIALTLDRLGRAEEAIARYQRYLELRPDAPEADYVRERVAALSAAGDLGGADPVDAGTATRDGADGATPDPAPDTSAGTDPPDAAAVSVEAPRDGSGGVGAGPWILVGVGGALVLGGTAALLVDDDGGVARPVGGVLLGVGAAAVVGGVLWAVLAGGRDDDERSGGASLRVQPLLSPTVAGAALSGRF